MYTLGISEQLRGQSKISLKVLERTINEHARQAARRNKLAIEDIPHSFRHLSSWSSGWNDSSWSTGWIDYSQWNADDNASQASDTMWSQHSEWRDYTSPTPWRSSSSYEWSDRYRD
jgi:hypothetical protein